MAHLENYTTCGGEILDFSRKKHLMRSEGQDDYFEPVRENNLGSDLV